jgi:hypothetical protein
MQIQLKDIDPELAARLFDNGQARAVLGISPKAAARHVSSDQTAPPISAGRIAMALLGTLSVYISGLVMMGFAIQEKFPDWLIGLFFVSVLVGIPICAVNWVRSGTLSGKKIGVTDGNSLRRTFQKEDLTPEELRALKNTGAFTPQQNQYLSALGSLLELNRRGQIDDAKSDSLLAHLTGLLASERDLQAQVKHVDSMVQADRIRQIESEEKDLSERLRTVGDPEARQDLEQSLEMCRARLRGFREMTPLVERLDAQRRLVRQTLASLEDSLSRMALTAGSSQNSAADSLNMENIQQNITEIQRQFYSTEQALKEVMSLRAF